MAEWEDFQKAFGLEELQDAGSTMELYSMAKQYGWTIEKSAKVKLGLE